MEPMEELFPLYLAHYVLKTKGKSAPEEGEAPTPAMIYAPGAMGSYWDLPRDQWRWDRDLGVLAPMFPDVWIEARADIPLRRLRQDLPSSRVAAIEAQRRAERGMFYEEEPRKIAARVGVRGAQVHTTELQEQRRKANSRADYLDELLAQERAFTDGARWIFQVMPFVEVDPGFTQRVNAMPRVAVDAEGRYLRHTAGTPNPGPIGYYQWRRGEGAGFPARNDGLDLSWFAEEVAFAAMYTLSFANCKNVGMEESSAQVSSKRLRKDMDEGDLQPVTFSRVKLDGHAGTGGDGGGDSKGAQGRLHFVRGHFKTYTEENKLLGKHVGTYFWANHARGDHSSGAVDTQYEV